MKKLLLDNAYESWKNAIATHNKILDGLSTLKFKKEFVASLHNAVELFLKQIMIDQNNKGVVIRSRDAGLWAAYDALDTSTTSLATFFSTLTEAQLSSFYSIGFQGLIDNHHLLLNISDTVIKSQLEKLQALRNDETHFFLDATFLSETDFVLLHNFMIEFYNLLLNNDIFPDYLLVFDTGKRVLPIQYEELSFDRKPLNSSFTYLKALQDSTYVQLLSDVFHEFGDISTPWGSVYSLAKTIVYQYPEYESQFTEILSFLELAEKNNMLEYSCETIETGECSELIPDKIDVFSISIKH